MRVCLCPCMHKDASVPSACTCKVSILAGCMSIVAVTLSVLQVLVESAYIRGGIIVTCGVVLSFAIYFCLRRICAQAGQHARALETW